MSSTRRSSRRQAPIKTTGPLSQWRHLSNSWRQQYIDFGHGRISRCTTRLTEATDLQRNELRSLGISFVALAISSAASVSGRSRVQKEQDLKRYITVAIQLGLPVNDNHNGECAVSMAAYHGMSEILIQLLDDAACPLRTSSFQQNAIFAAIRNGQHVTLEIILSKRTAEAIRAVSEEEATAERTGKYFLSLQEAIMKGDFLSVQLLLRFHCASMSDLLAKILYQPINRRLKHYKKFERILHHLYPTIPNIKHWRKELHWSFPATDREVINWLWHLMLHHPSNSKIIPSEIWLRVFSFFGRGWFACRRYGEVGRASAADVLQRNILE
ncbi:hypothetical protein HJC23_005150 [Cyclotella cryptica]|uniref:Ankyrin n=1 Tax=Cyclotella cryptica TaxID=29204 RepID=A0ABD3QHK4_9STRA|eukprot:CCRYP_005854-RA/>CCRYP_005854-RA protein AED:0.13 eAED:0.13 QI:0/-1/0/1/-1/1/1/0/326